MNAFLFFDQAVGVLYDVFNNPDFPVGLLIAVGVAISVTLTVIGFFESKLGG